MTQSKVDTVTIDLGGYTMESNGSFISSSNLDNITTISGISTSTVNISDILSSDDQITFDFDNIKIVPTLWKETLGISWYEGALVDAIPMMPDRLSYSEMALPEFLYPSEWTENYDAYLYHRDKVVAQIVNYMDNYTDLQVSLEKQRIKLNKEFFSGAALYDTIKQSD